MVRSVDILEAYFDCRKCKRRSPSAVLFECNFEEYCMELTEEINNRTYEIGTSTAFIITRPKKREVFAADFRDRVVHHWLVSRLEPLFERYFISDTYNCRKGKGTLYGVQCLEDKLKAISDNYTRNCYIARFDMKGFFMSIHKPTLWKMLKTFIERHYNNPQDKDDVLWVARKIVLNCPEKNCIRKSPEKSWEDIPADKSLFTCGEDYGLPIGNLTSQMFANFYLAEFDWAMVYLFGIGYGRYVDDFFIISMGKQAILEMIKVMGEYLRTELQVTLHPDKIYLQQCKKGVKFTGRVVLPGRQYVGKRTVGNFRSLVRSMNRHPEKVTTEQALCRVNSYLGFLRHANSYNIRKEVLNSMNGRWWKRMHVKGRYEVAAAKKEETIRYNVLRLIKEREEL